MAGDKTYITDSGGKLHRATRVHAVTPTDIVWSSNPNDYSVQVKVGGKWHRAILTMDAGAAQFFDNINIDKALVTGADGKQHTALIVKPESTVTLSDIKTDTHGTIAGTTTGETAVSTYSENWSNVKWQDNVNVYKVLVTGSDGKVHTALLTTSAGGGTVQAIVLGPSPLLLPDAIANSLSYVKAFGGTEQRNLPDGYIERQFIYMMEGSYLLTDIVPTYDGHYELDFQTTTVTASRAWLGARDVAYGGLFVTPSSTKAVIVDAFGANDGTDRWATGWTPSDNTRYKFVFNNKVATFYQGDTVIASNTFTSTGTTTRPLAIKANNDNGTIASTYGELYVYGFKAWNAQGELIMDLVPAVQKGTVPVVGFYDTVSGTFKTATAGTFAAGGEAVPSPDTPMDIVCNNGVLKYGQYGKNLFNKDADWDTWYPSAGGTIANGGTNRTVVIRCLPNTKYYFKHCTYRGGLRAFYTEEENWDIGSPCSYTGAVAGDANVVYSITTSANAKWLFVCFGRGDSSTTATYAQQASDYMLSIEELTSATEYEPYHFGLHTDGTVETINAHGKNLFDKNGTLANGYYRPTDGVWVANASFRTQDYIKASQNTNYALSTTNLQSGGNYLIMSAWDSEHNWLGTVASSTFGSDAGTSVTITGITPANTAYLSVSFAPAYRDINTLQIEQGSTATTYEPYYDGGTATAEMLLKVGDYTDVQSILDGVVTRNVGVKVFDGTETITGHGTIDGLVWMVNNNVLADDTAIGICSHYNFTTAGIVPMPSGNFRFAMQGSNQRIVFKDTVHASGTGTTSANNFKAYLADQYAAGTPVIVIYPLATPTTESVAGQTLQVQAGNNTLEITQASLNNLELEAEYQKSA